MRTRLSGIRSAAVTWEEYVKFLAASDEVDQITFALSIPVVETTLQEYSPFVYKRIREIASGELSPSTKKGRKAMRHLTMTMARAATRSTPSRLLGRIGGIKDAEIVDSGIQEIAIEDEWTIRSTKPLPQLPAPKDQLVRWNPSVINTTGRSFVTVPRNNKNQPYGSVERNELIDFVADVAREGISRNALTARIVQKYNLDDRIVAVNALDSLIDREFLLDEAATTFTSRYDTYDYFDLSAGEKSSSELSDWLNTYGKASVESSRHARVILCKSDLALIQEAYEFMLQKDLCGSMDQGMARELASMIHEQYGYSRIRLSELVRPGTGITYGNVLDRVKKAHDLGHNRNLTSIASKTSKWVDLAQEGFDLPDGRSDWRTPDSFAVPVSIMKDLMGHTWVLSCDGVPGLPADVLSARFISDLGSASRCEFQKGVTTNQDGDSKDSLDPTAGIDWTSASDNANVIREARFHRDRKLNVNALAFEENEFTINDVWVWSDGDHVYVEDSNHAPLWFQPQSMVSMAMYPDWISLLLVAGTDGWPSMSFGWEGLENYYDRFPGVRYGKIVFSRPKYRYVGEVSVEAFNNWCDSEGIGRFVRIGKMDRKVLIDRTSRSAYYVIQHLLNSSGNWVEDAQCEAGGPVANLAKTGNSVHCELVYRGRFPQSMWRPGQPGNPGVAPDVDDSTANYLIPGVSGVANLIVVPRSGKTNALLSAIESTISGYDYFVRYFTKQGQPCLRLRIQRDYLSRQETRQAFSALLFDGWATDISDEIHRLEVERYGGSKAFEAFKELFKVESHWIGELAASGHLDNLELAQKALLVLRWLDTLNSTVGIDLEKIVGIRDQGESVGGFDLSRISLPDFLEASFPADGIRQAMEAIAVALGENSSPWPVSAHLWCNRLGISVDDERQVWQGVAKYFREVERNQK